MVYGWSTQQDLLESMFKCGVPPNLHSIPVRCSGDISGQVKMLNVFKLKVWGTPRIRNGVQEHQSPLHCTALHCTALWYWRPW